MASTRAAIYIWHHEMESHMKRTVKNTLKGSFRDYITSAGLFVFELLHERETNLCHV